MALDVIWLQGSPQFCIEIKFKFLSFLAGLSACIASNPVDVVRTRMMVQRKTARWWFPTFKFWRFFSNRSSLGLPLHSSYGETLPHTYFKSSLRCGLHTVFTKCWMKLSRGKTQVQSEGLLALYKGFFPAFARMGPWNVIFFLVYEKLQHSYPYVGRWDHIHQQEMSWLCLCILAQQAPLQTRG